MNAFTSAYPSAPELTAFTADVLAEGRRTTDPRAIADFVKRRLGSLVADPGWLPEAAREGSPDRYRQHLLYVAPDRSFSVVALVWTPGQATPIHDHVCWCVVGVYEGAETQTRYHLVGDGSERFLVETGRELAPRGTCTALVPPEENIHRVANGGETRAISLHVYGADIEALGSSINRRFDDLSIREPVSGAAPRAWRTERVPEPRSTP